MSIAINTTLLIEAAKTGNADEVRRLIPLSDPKFNDSWALRWATVNGHTQCVELLIPVSDPKSDNSRALLLAVEHGYADCVELLIPVSDPKFNDSAALRRAVEYGHVDCVELLYPVSNPIVALNRLQKMFPNHPNKWLALERKIDAEQLRTVLHEELGDSVDQPNEFKVQRKM